MDLEDLLEEVWQYTPLFVWRILWTGEPVYSLSIVYRVAKSQTQLKWLSKHASEVYIRCWWGLVDTEIRLQFQCPDIWVIRLSSHSFYFMKLQLSCWSYLSVFFFINFIERQLLYRILLFSVTSQHESAIGIHIPLPFWTSLPSPSPSHGSRLIQSPCLSFLSHTANSCWLSILHMVTFITV